MCDRDEPRPGECPSCGSTADAQGGDHEFQSGWATIELYCEACGAEWVARYTYESCRIVHAGSTTPAAKGD